MKALFAPVIAPLALVLASTASQAAVFTPGDLFYASNVAPTRVWNITGGGNFAADAPFATAGAAGNSSLGQIAWSGDLSTMYVSNFSGDTIYTVGADGSSSFYAAATEATGMIMTADGRLLVNEFSSRRVMDYTNPLQPTFFATLPGFSRNMRQLPTGEILVAGSGGAVYDISSGTASIYATIAGSNSSYLGDIDFTSDGRVFVTGGFAHEANIFEITGGGTFANMPFATITGASIGAAFGLAIEPGTNRILVAPLEQNYIIDVTAGGSIDSTNPANRYAILPTGSDMAFDFVPVPEPSTLLLAPLAVFGLLRRSRRSMAAA